MSYLTQDESLDPIEAIWYSHIQYCKLCADESRNRCLVGECIYQELLKKLNAMCGEPKE